MTGDYKDNGLVGLCERDRQALEVGSAIAPKVRQSAGAFTIQDKRDLPRYGFREEQKHLIPGLVLPLHSVDRETVLYQIRPHDPRTDLAGKTVKYELPGKSRLVVECNPLAREAVLDSSVPLIITEGARKAWSAISRGLACISLVGVDCWQQDKNPLPDWYKIPMQGRTVYLAFDYDESPRSRQSVYYALRRLAPFLKGKGADLRFIYFAAGPDGEKTGVDDFFARGGTTEEFFGLASAELRRPPEPGDVELCHLPHTDIGNAERMAARFGDQLRYCPQRRAWLIWTGTHWQEDVAERVMTFAKQTARRIYDEASVLTLQDAEKGKALAAWGMKSQSLRLLQAMVRLAQSEPSLVVTADELDADPMLLNCKNGTLDLRTAALREHLQCDLLTYCLDAEYRQDAPAPVWQRYLDRVQPDPSMRAFLKRAGGYSLTGGVGEECLFFLYGSGRNGKSKFVEAVKHVLKPLAYALDKTHLMHDPSGGQRGPTSERIALRGKRFVPVSELQNGDRLDEALVKTLTGGDTIAGRELYSKAENFPPTFKLWLAGNHKPRIRGNDEGIWSRIRLVHFAVTIPLEERDPQLLDKLKAEAEGILAWLIAGCMEWQRNGLNPPPQVLHDTETYRQEEDPLADFLADQCRLHASALCTKAELWQAYVEHTRQTGEQAFRNQRGFNPVVASLTGVSSDRGTGGKHIWRGIGLRKEDDDAPDSDASVPDVHSHGEESDRSDASDRVLGKPSSRSAYYADFTQNPVTSVTSVTKDGAESEPASFSVTETQRQAARLFAEQRSTGHDHTRKRSEDNGSIEANRAKDYFGVLAELALADALQRAGIPATTPQLVTTRPPSEPDFLVCSTRYDVKAAPPDQPYVNINAKKHLAAGTRPDFYAVVLFASESSFQAARVPAADVDAWEQAEGHSPYYRQGRANMAPYLVPSLDAFRPEEEEDDKWE